jgi:uncharacterized protein YhbP (UPF0306 family)
MLYANDGLAIYLWSRPDTTVARHSEQNPMVSFTVDEYAADWTKTKGIQGSGEIQPLLDPGEIRHAVELFQMKFASLRETSTANLVFFRVNPTRLTFIDNEAEAGAAGQGPQALGMDFRQSVVFSVFRDLPQQDAESLAARLQPVQVDASEVIVHQGAPADKFFIIVDGEVEVVREDDGQQRKVATLRSGHFFGEVAILRDMPRSATVRAVVPTTLLTMAREDFRGLVAQSLATTQDFDQVIQERLGAMAGSDQGAAGGAPRPTP